MNMTLVTTHALEASFSYGGLMPYLLFGTSQAIALHKYHRAKQLLLLTYKDARTVSVLLASTFNVVVPTTVPYSEKEHK
jgi:hypothetical protein